MPRDECFRLRCRCCGGQVASLANNGSLFGRTASNRPNLFHSATAMRSRLKLWNDSGTKRARIGDSPRDLIRSPQHLALGPTGDTRSSLKRLHKVRFSGGILKNREGTESNQKWSRVNMIHTGCIDIRRSPSPLVGEGGAERSSATGEGFSPPAQTSRVETDPSSGASRHLLPQGEK